MPSHGGCCPPRGAVALPGKLLWSYFPAGELLPSQGSCCPLQHLVCSLLGRTAGRRLWLMLAPCALALSLLPALSPAAPGSALTPFPCSLSPCSADLPWQHLPSCRGSSSLIVHFLLPGILLPELCPKHQQEGRLEAAAWPQLPVSPPSLVLCMAEPILGAFELTGGWSCPVPYGIDPFWPLVLRRCFCESRVPEVK